MEWCGVEGRRGTAKQNRPRGGIPKALIRKGYDILNATMASSLANTARAMTRMRTLVLTLLLDLLAWSLPERHLAHLLLRFVTQFMPVKAPPKTRMGTGAQCIFLLRQL